MRQEIGSTDGMELGADSEPENFLTETFSRDRNTGMSAAERLSTVMEELASLGMKLSANRVYTLDENSNASAQHIEQHVLATPVWSGGCVALVGGQALSAMWGHSNLLCVVTFQSCTAADIKQVLCAANSMIKMDRRDVESADRSDGDTLPWGTFISSNKTQTIPTVPVGHLALRANSDSVSLHSLPTGNRNGEGEMLFCLRIN